MSWYYVCDACGTLHVCEDQLDDDLGWSCDYCGSDRTWEFQRSDAAEHHSRHIKRGLGSGLFRQVKR